MTEPDSLGVNAIARRVSLHHRMPISNIGMLSGRAASSAWSSARIAKVRRIHAYACRGGDIVRDLFGNVACFGVAEFLGLLRALAPRGRLGHRRTFG